MEKTMKPTTSSIARLSAAAAVLFLLGCSSNNAVTTNSDPAAAFVGSWTFGSGSLQPVCGGLGASLTPFDLTGDTMTITHTSTTEVSTSLTGMGVMCNVNFTVSAMTASAQSGQTCVVMVDGTAVTIDITTWTLVVTGDSMSMSMAGTANATLFTCAPTATGTATRANGGG
jgi:hypothetical protein